MSHALEYVGDSAAVRRKVPDDLAQGRWGIGAMREAHINRRRCSDDAGKPRVLAKARIIVEDADLAVAPGMERGSGFLAA